MIAPIPRSVSASLCALILCVPACAPGDGVKDPGQQAPAITNRLAVPPAVVGNLGITFEQATRGRLGTWHQVPGQLEVPESSRFSLRAPARGRIVATVARWASVEAGAVVAELSSPEVQAAQRAIEHAEGTLARATVEVDAARERLAESGAHLAQATAFEAASRARLEELQALAAAGNALTARETIEAQKSVTEAGRARLDAAIVRDGLRSLVAAKELEVDQARLAVAESLHELAVLTGTAVAELAAPGGDGPAWRAVTDLAMRAPAAGVVVELHVARGELVAAGAEVASVFATGELRFRGHVPEGDLGALAAGSPVRLEFPSRELEPVTTELEPPLPVADAATRMIHVEAVVPDPAGRLVHGMSVMAHVQVRESASAEVLIPERCVVFDGLEAIVFRRDPDDPHVVIRTPVELGARAAGRVEVLSGVLEGDQLVADGVHQLRLTGLGKAPEGGHFHADGTWHSDHK